MSRSSRSSSPYIDSSISCSPASIRSAIEVSSPSRASVHAVTASVTLAKSQMTRWWTSSSSRWKSMRRRVGCSVMCASPQGG
jgi:hypothetical protein